MKKIAICFEYIIICALAVITIYYGHQYAVDKIHSGIIYDKETEIDSMLYGQVVSIESSNENVQNPGQMEIVFLAKIFEGEKHKNEVVQAKQIISSDDKQSIPISIGEKVALLSYGDIYLFQYYYRLDKIIILGAVFTVLILLMGGSKGFRTLLALGFTCLSIFYLFIPFVRAGYNVYISCGLTCLYIIATTYAIVYGINQKSITAAFSCIVGVLASGLITFIMDKAMKLTGYINDEAFMLETLLGIENVSVKAILFSMITIGALGAVMDVSMSIISPLWELKANDSYISAGALIQSGFSIGRDVMGTMTSTLVLAYIGGSLITVLMYSASNYPLMSLLNKEEIIYEFLQSLTGSLSLLATIPVAVLLSTVTLSKSK